LSANKTEPTSSSATDFLDAIADPTRREDAKSLCALIERAVGEPPRMWGSAIVGFGSYRYRYDSGRQGKSSAAGFSPRARELVVYLPAHSERTADLLAQLGKHKSGKSCVYIRKLDDVNQAVLGELIADSYHAVKARHP
jgi:hypothetical protein